MEIPLLHITASFETCPDCGAEHQQQTIDTKQQHDEKVSSHFIYSHFLYSHFVNSHLVYSHFVYSHLVYFSVYAHFVFFKNNW